MVPLSALAERMRADVLAWSALRLDDLLFARPAYGLGTTMVLAGVACAVLLWRAAAASRPAGRHAVVVPAVLGQAAAARIAMLRHAPLALALAGVPFLAIAVADPFAAVSTEVMSYPGRRLALLIDASSSMMVPFEAERLRDDSQNDAAFLTATAAAAQFVRQRREGRYRDFIAIVEFGDEAYVVTPFTIDYDNALLSISLIGDWGEYMRFPDGGTSIGRAIDRGTGLFDAFGFLNASGNAMVIFSDGQDTQVAARGRSLAQVLSRATAARIPVYLVRTAGGKQLGDLVPDGIWKPAVEATGGRFYAAATEADLLRAIADIDRRSAGTIELKTYTTREPRFAPFAAAAAALWTLGLALKAANVFFTKFP